MTRRTVPRLHLIGPLDAISLERYYEVAAAVSAGGVEAVHLRLPGEPGGVVKEAASRLLEVFDQHRTLLFINDRVDVAALLGLPAQLGERSLTASEARTMLGPRQLIGRSVHDANGALAAERDGADFVVAGHVYDTPSKDAQPGRGLPWLRELCAGVSTPVIAIGGITSARIPDVLAAGAYGVAVGRELLLSADPFGAAIQLRNHLE